MKIRFVAMAFVAAVILLPLVSSPSSAQSMARLTPASQPGGLLDTLTWRTLPYSAGSFRFADGDSVAIWFKPLAPCSLKALRIHFFTFAGNILLDVFRSRYDGHITSTDSTDANGWIGTYENDQWIPGDVLGHSPLGEHVWGPFPVTVTSDDDNSWVEIPAAFHGEEDLGDAPFCVGLNIYQISGFGISSEMESTVPYHFFKYYRNCCGPGDVHNGWFLRSFSLWIEVIVSYYGNTPPEITAMTVQNDTYKTGPCPVEARLVDANMSHPEHAGVREAYLHWNIGGTRDSTIMPATGSGMYTAEIPPAGLNDPVEYYVSAVDLDGARSTNTPRIFTRIAPVHPEADVLLVDYGNGFGLSEYWPAVIESLGYTHEYWDAQRHNGIDASVVEYGWSTVIPWGMYRMNVPIIYSREYSGHLWANFLQSGTVDVPVNLLFASTDYFGLNRDYSPKYRPGDFAYDFFGLDSATTEHGIGSEKTLFGVAGDPVSGEYAQEPFRHTWPLNWFHQYWLEYTFANEQGSDLFRTADGISTGTRCDGGRFKTVFLPWDIEYLLEDVGTDTVPSTEFRNLVRNILEWFGTEKERTGIENGQTATFPQHCVLFQNYPNPFNVTTSIRFAVGSGQSSVHVVLKIFNVLGQEVRTLVDGQQPAGYHSIGWDGTDARGSAVTSGIYFCRLTVDHAQRSETRSMVLLR